MLFTFRSQQSAGQFDFLFTPKRELLLEGLTFLSNTRALATQLVSRRIMKKLRISNDSTTCMQKDAPMLQMPKLLSLA